LVPDRAAHLGCVAALPQSDRRAEERNKKDKTSISTATEKTDTHGTLPQTAFA
jgi:hypothetical protein